MGNENAERDIDRRTPEEIAESLRDSVHEAMVLVGPGQYSPYPDHERIMVLVVKPNHEDGPVVVWDRFLCESSILPLCDALRAYAREVCPGEFDTMYATPWSYAWTKPPTPFRVYDRAGLLVWVENDYVHVQQGTAIKAVPLKDIAHVDGSLSADWSVRTIRIVTRDGANIEVAEDQEPVALLDPTYDGIDLMFDAAWLGRLGKTMAAGLGVSYINDPALR